MDELDEFKRQVALLFARYLDGEGCGCCEDHDHDDVQRELGEALGMPRYDDDSGIDYYKVIKGAW